MELKVLLIIFSFIAVGLALYFIAMYVAERAMKRKVTAHSLFYGFRQKMWMTVGLGFVFFSLYLLIVVLGRHFNDPDARLNFFLTAYEHPTIFIYLGLVAFAAISMGIYLVRMVIKYLYNTRRAGKD